METEVKELMDWYESLRELNKLPPYDMKLAEWQSARMKEFFEQKYWNDQRNPYGA